MNTPRDEFLGTLYVDGRAVCVRYGQSEGIRVRDEQDDEAEAPDVDGPEFGA